MCINTDKVVCKPLKTGIRVSLLGVTMKLSFPQWYALKDPFSYKNYYIDAPASLLTVNTELQTQRALTKLGLLGPEKYIRASGELKLLPYVLTELGKHVVHMLPPCPNRDTWPKPQELSPNRVKVSPAQREQLLNWNRNISKAVPIGGSQLEEGRWIRDGFIPRPSTRALLKMGLIEPGISGVGLSNGQFVLLPNSTVGLVYRLTVHGGLMAGVV